MYFDENLNKYICWECFKEKFEEDCNNSNSKSTKIKYINRKQKIIKKIQCKNCGKLINRYQMFCNNNCKIEYTQNHKSIFKEGNNCEKHPNEDLIYGQVCWSCYQENFKENNNYDELKEFLFNL